MSEKTKGILCIIFSALSFAFMSLFIKLSGDIPTLQKSFCSSTRGIFDVKEKSYSFEMQQRKL